MVARLNPHLPQKYARKRAPVPDKRGWIPEAWLVDELDDMRLHPGDLNGIENLVYAIGEDGVIDLTGLDEES